MAKKTYKVKGMDCTSCAALLEMNLEDAGIKAICSYPRQSLEVEIDNEKEGEVKIKEIVKKLGYTLE